MKDSLGHGACEMAWWIKGMPQEAGDLSSKPSTNTKVGGENQPTPPLNTEITGVCQQT